MVALHLARGRVESHGLERLRATDRGHWADLLAARSQMAMSLAFHIIFAVVGIGMPVLMVLAERRWQRTRDPIYLELAKRYYAAGNFLVSGRKVPRDGGIILAVLL